MAALTGDRIVEDQAALRRVATLVAGAAGPEEVFGAVAAQVGQLLAVDFTVLIRSGHPAVLVEGRAAACLGVLARRSAVPVRLYVQTTTRYPEPIEMTAYYVVSEGLANAAKHAATVLDVGHRRRRHASGSASATTAAAAPTSSTGLGSSASPTASRPSVAGSDCTAPPVRAPSWRRNSHWREELRLPADRPHLAGCRSRRPPLAAGQE
jgi:hypothetical protein